jgi:hypothetical protein
MPKNSSNIDVTLPSIQEQIDCFLKKISDKYIETMKNNTVFAGPIELKTIGKILSSKIVVHYYILNPNAPSFEYAENDIHILFKDKNTYQAILKTLNGNYKLSKTKINANCLFTACIEAAIAANIMVDVRYSELYESVGSNNLRQDVCYTISKDPDEMANIKRLFKSLVLAKDKEAIKYYKDKLPDMCLRKQAISLAKQRLAAENLDQNINCCNSLYKRCTIM